MTGLPVCEDHPGFCEEIDWRRPEWKVEVATVSLSDQMLHMKDINFEELYTGLLLLVFSGSLILCMQCQSIGQPNF